MVFSDNKFKEQIQLPIIVSTLPTTDTIYVLSVSCELISIYVWG